MKLNRQVKAILNSTELLECRDRWTGRLSDLFDDGENHNHGKSRSLSLSVGFGDIHRLIR